MLFDVSIRQVLRLNPSVVTRCARYLRFSTAGRPSCVSSSFTFSPPPPEWLGDTMILLGPGSLLRATPWAGETHGVGSLEPFRFNPLGV